MGPCAQTAGSFQSDNLIKIRGALIDRWAVPTLQQDDQQAFETQRGMEVADEVSHDHDIFRAHSFGGDAAYVDRLSQALCRRGHEVHVYFCVDAFNAVRGDHPLREYTPPPGIHLHPLKSRSGILSPLATQATGLPLFKTAELREALDDPETDVIHFHNISLVGGPGVLGLGTNRHAVRIMTAHEHWLICPMHLLWKYDREPCAAPSCVSCCLKGGRPPQLWRLSSAIERGLGNLDALIFPSGHALEEHRRRGIGEHVPPGARSPISCPMGGREGSRIEPAQIA